MTATTYSGASAWPAGTRKHRPEGDGAHDVRLFGSLARGDHAEASDIDLLVDLDDGVGLFQLGVLAMELEELLQTYVDVVSTGALRPRDAGELADAVPL